MIANAAPQPTVLVIDDDASMRELFALVLGQTSFKIICAATTAEARESLRHQTPDLILLDLHLADTDGVQFAEELSVILEDRNVPILAVSASTDVAISARVRKAGCAGFLPKPINPRTFGSEIKQYLTRDVAAEQPAIAVSKAAEESLAQLRSRFVDEALQQIEILTARDNAGLLSDCLLADAAHRWAGISNLEGLPNIESVARSLEISAREKRSEQISRIRADLSWMRDQFHQSRLSDRRAFRHA